MFDFKQFVSGGSGALSYVGENIPPGVGFGLQNLAFFFFLIYIHAPQSYMAY